MAFGLGSVDLALLAVLLVSTAVGMWRGLVFELMSLMGWLVAYVVAQAASPWVAERLPAGLGGAADNPALRLGLAFALAFLGTLMGWSLLARLVRLLVHATPLTVIDRLLGAVFGMARGGVLLLVLATLVSFTPAARASAWQDSKGAAWLAALVQGLKPALPAAWGRHLPDATR